MRGGVLIEQTSNQVDYAHGGSETESKSVAPDSLVLPVRRLAPREQQIIDLITRGRTDKAIAAELSMSVRTVRTHLERLYRKRRLHSRAQAVALSTTAFSSSVAVGDFNGDGKPDLAVANGNSMDVSILLGNGDGTFRGQETMRPRAYPTRSQLVTSTAMASRTWPL